MKATTPFMKKAGFKSQREYHANYIKERRKFNKLKLTKYKGGKCCVCGYKKYHGALDFHHLGEKNFSMGNSMTISMKRLKKEADKTILVCKNCHAEIHGGLIKKYKK